MRSPVLLVVDDRPQLLQVRKSNLETFGFSVVTATTVSAAIAVLGNIAIDAVLMEYKSEGMDSEAVAFHIRHRFPQQPIILISAYSDIPERVLWLVDEYVMRSEPIEHLVQVIERVTRAREKQAPRSDNVKHYRATA
jgi:DNA-binding NtrC family response regulator